MGSIIIARYGHHRKLLYKYMSIAIRVASGGFSVFSAELVCQRRKYHLSTFSYGQYNS